MSILTQDFVLSAISSEKAGSEFPIDFDDVWQSIGYSRKDNAKRSLLSSGYVTGEDFRILLKNEENSKRGQPEEKIFLTIDCFKAFCMLTRSEQGREVRHYFIAVERAYRTQLEAQFTAPSHTAPTFTYPAAQLQAIAGYASLSYTKAAIRRDFVECLHSEYLSAIA